VLLFGPLYHLTERRWQSGSWSGWKGWPFGSRSWLTDGTTATTARPPCGQLARSSPSRLLRV
jgi:hypothetical protein